MQIFNFKKFPKRLRHRFHKVANLWRADSIAGGSVDVYSTFQLNFNSKHHATLNSKSQWPSFSVYFAKHAVESPSSESQPIDLYKAIIKQSTYKARCWHGFDFSACLLPARWLRTGKNNYLALQPEPQLIWIAEKEEVDKKKTKIKCNVTPLRNSCLTVSRLFVFHVYKSGVRFILTRILTYTIDMSIPFSILLADLLLDVGTLRHPR